MSEDLFRSSDLEAFLDALTAKMAALAPSEEPVVNAMGNRENARVGAPPRVVWVPDRERYDDPDVKLPSAHAIARTDETFEVVVWGEDYQRTKALRNRLAGALEALSTRLSSRMVSGEWAFGGLDTRGAALTLSITLYFLITDAEYVAIAPSTTTVSGVVTDAAGQNPEPV